MLSSDTLYKLTLELVGNDSGIWNWLKKHYRFFCRAGWLYDSVKSFHYTSQWRTHCRGALFGSPSPIAWHSSHIQNCPFSRHARIRSFQKRCGDRLRQERRSVILWKLWTLLSPAYSFEVAIISISHCRGDLFSRKFVTVSNH